MSILYVFYGPNRRGQYDVNKSYHAESREPYSVENDAGVVEINDDNNGNEDHNGEAVGYIDTRSNENK